MSLAPYDSLPHRRSIRLRHYDYTHNGGYFITICTEGRRCLLGRALVGGVQLSALGTLVDACWRALREHHPGVELDYWVVMPNHVHGILMLHHDFQGTTGRAPTGGAGTTGRAPTGEAFGKPVPNSLPTIIRSFKASVTRQGREPASGGSTVIWQRGYYEHIIRNEVELKATREYIVENPLKWSIDRENPDAAAVESISPWEVPPL